MSYPSYPSGGGAPGGYPQQPGPGYPGQPAPGGYPAQGQPGYPPQPGYPGAPPGGGAAPYPPTGGAPPHAQPALGFAGAAAAVTAFQMPRPAGHAPGGSPGYPPSSAPYPGAPPTSAPYPGAPPSSSAPYPGAPPAAAPYPGAPPAAAPYPGAPPAAAPYPGAPPSSSPYPGGAPPPAGPYPPAGGAQAPYPGGPPPAAGGGYPSSSPYPAAAPVAATGAPYAGGGGAPPPAAGYPQQGSVRRPAQPPTAAMASMSMSHGSTSRAAAPPKGRPSVRAAANFNKETDAQAIRKAMKGFGCDEKAIILILARRSSEQRTEIRNHFKTMYGKDLMNELKGELHGHLESACLALARDPIEYDCFSLHQAMKGAGTNEKCLIEILCSRTNTQKEAIKKKFKSLYGKDLEKWVKSETSGHFERLLVSLLSANRDESTTVDPTRAQADAQTLYKAGEARWGTDESAFNYILASRNYAQLRATFEAYSRICKYDIEKSIEREMSGDLKDGMLAIVRIARDTPGFFANSLYKSMKGLGTDDNTLVRVLVTRCEIDMEDIKVRFHQEYKKTLRQFIEGDTSGNYRRLLLCLINDGGFTS